MKNTFVYLIIISFMLQSCNTYKAIDLKETQLIVSKEYKITQGNKTEIVKLISVNHSLIVVSVDKSEKNISISNIKKIEEQKPSLIAMIGAGLLIGVIWLTIEIVDSNLNSDE